jgi:hypothetical protein
VRLSSGPPLRAGSIVNENQKRRKVVTWIKKIDLNWRRICHTRSLCADSAMTYRNLVDDKTISNERIRKAIYRSYIKATVLLACAIADSKDIKSCGGNG